MKQPNYKGYYINLLQRRTPVRIGRCVIVPSSKNGYTLIDDSDQRVHIARSSIRGTLTLLLKESGAIA